MKYNVELHEGFYRTAKSELNWGKNSKKLDEQEMNMDILDVLLQTDFLFSIFFLHLVPKRLKFRHDLMNETLQTHLL